jgi:NAD(P)H-flavin reductase
MRLFLDELQSLEGDKLIASMTEMAKSRRSWSGETGFLSQEMLGRHLKGAASRIYYIAGPPAMVKGLHGMFEQGRNQRRRHSRGRICRVLSQSSFLKVRTPAMRLDFGGHSKKGNGID